MSQQTNWIPTSVDLEKPSAARAYDYVLGGNHNFSIDREFVEEVLRRQPEVKRFAIQNRAFMRRAVLFLVERGIRQFLDLGSGLPTDTNVHQVAQTVDPTTRVIYVDNDPMVLVHGRALLASNDTTAVVQADIRSPREILDHDVVRAQLDFSRPIGLLMLSILHHLHDDENPGAVAATLRDALPAGSHLAIIHFWDPAEEQPEIAAKVVDAEWVFNETLGTGRWRKRDEIQAYFGDFEMVEPGLVPLAEWRPDAEDKAEQTDSYYTMIGGVARKP